MKALALVTDAFGGPRRLLVIPDKNDEIVDAIDSAIGNSRFPSRTDLEYYSVAQFNKRCHAMLDALTIRVGMPQHS